MRVLDSNVTLLATHSLKVSDARTENLQVWGGASEQAQTLTKPSAGVATLVELSEAGRELAKTNAADEPVLFELSEQDKRKIALIEKFIEVMTGKKLRIVLPEVSRQHNGNGAATAMAGTARGQITGGVQQLQGWGLRYDLRETYSEEERMAFSAAGVIKTADGREIAFSAGLTMSRSFYAENHISIRAGDALKDPLVINLDVPAAQLTQIKFHFDIDSDGTMDQISFVRPGSGFLALDKNGDGVINNGGELFGASSGDGFAELAAYDEDGNGWIDENDAIYNKLRIWTKDTDGKDYLLLLGQAGVGAVYLGKAATEFALNDVQNVQHGQLRSTGIFLRENGTPGTIQQVDLAV